MRSHLEACEGLHSYQSAAGSLLALGEPCEILYIFEWDLGDKSFGVEVLERNQLLQCDHGLLLCIYVRFIYIYHDTLYGHIFDT